MAYAEFGITSNFSFLRGASHPEELVATAKELGFAAIGIADRNSVTGVVRAREAAKQAGLRLAVGARLVFCDGTPDILAYPQSRDSWGRLCRLLSLGKLRGEKGECHLGIDDLLAWREGMNLILCPPAVIETDRLTSLLERLKGSDLWLAATMTYRGDDNRHLKRLVELAAISGIPLIATNDVFYHTPDRRPLQDILTCIREHLTLDKAGRRLEANAERHLKSPEEMARQFVPIPDAINQTMRFLDGCRFFLEEVKFEYPDETPPRWNSPQEMLEHLVAEGVKRRYPDGMSDKVREALTHELQVIGELGYASYFLTVYEIVRFARYEKKILCQGRGSAANSAICYCLGVTEIDPDKTDLLFERFVSVERREPPDIDIDFEHERREEVIQYIYQRYGRDYAALTAVTTCYRARSAIREVGKVFGLSEDITGRLADTLWGSWSKPVTPERAEKAGLQPSDPRLGMALHFAAELIGFPRHLSQHVGGFVISRQRVDETVPIENAAMDDRTVIEWNKDDLDAMGMLKVDVLGLGMLSCLQRAFTLLHEHYTLPHAHDIPTIPEDDKAVYRMLGRADAIGVFQVESRAQMSMLPRLKPNCLYDLVVEVAIVRPGPIQGNMVHPYLRRRLGLEEPDYGPNDQLRPVLEKTCGIPLFQEQAMRIAIVAAGFTPSEADKLRRAMATFRHVGTIGLLRDKFIAGMLKNGYPLEFVENCFRQIEGFGEYGFPESHAYSFALLAYASAWFKCHYPDVFATALINSQPMGFYAPAQIVRDAAEHGIVIRPVDINSSSHDCSLEPAGPDKASLHERHADMAGDIRSTHAIRLGFCQVKGMSKAEGDAIAAHRGRGFDSIRDLWLRTGLAPATLEKLAKADAFHSLGLSRRDALWSVRALRRSGDKDDLPLFAPNTMPEQEPDSALTPMLPGEEVIEDYRHLHLSLKAHPVSFLRREMDKHRITMHDHLRRMPTGRRVTVSGLVLVRQRPGTAGGVIFLTLEDETGIANVIVWPKVFETYRPVVLGSRLIAVTGTLQNESGVIHVVADRIEDCSNLIRLLSMEHGAPASSSYAAMPQGRNFH